MRCRAAAYHNIGPLYLQCLILGWASDRLDFFQQISCQLPLHGENFRTTAAVRTTAHPEMAIVVTADADHRTARPREPAPPRRKWRGPLSLTAVVPPAVLRLGTFEVKRVPARLISRAGMNQHAGHLLGMDGQHEATVGARV